MKKIMFNDRYGLTQAVIDGRKSMTRRVVPENEVEDYKVWRDDFLSLITGRARYKVGEVVAVAMAYRDVYEGGFPVDSRYDPFRTAYSVGGVKESDKGWSNKMFVRADIMPLQIRITNVKAERLKDISDEDCLKEGIDYIGGYSDSYYFGHGVNNIRLGNSPREAFAALIDKISGKGTWKANPWVYAYEFELIK